MDTGDKISKKIQRFATNLTRDDMEMLHAELSKDGFRITLANFYIFILNKRQSGELGKMMCGLNMMWCYPNGILLKDRASIKMHEGYATALMETTSLPDLFAMLDDFVVASCANTASSDYTIEIYPLYWHEPESESEPEPIDDILSEFGFSSIDEMFPIRA